MADVSTLVQQMHETLSTIQNTIATINDTEHDAKLASLEQERDSNIAALLASFQAEADDISSRREAERLTIDERRRKEDQELEAKRRKEDEELAGRTELEDVARHRVLDEGKKRIDDTADGMMDQVEEEARLKLEDGRKRIIELEERRKEINRLLDEHLSSPFPPAPRRRARLQTNGLATAAATASKTLVPISAEAKGLSSDSPLSPVGGLVDPGSRENTADFDMRTPHLEDEVHDLTRSVTQELEPQGVDGAQETPWEDSHEEITPTKARSQSSTSEAIYHETAEPILDLTTTRDFQPLDLITEPPLRSSVSIVQGMPGVSLETKDRDDMSSLISEASDHEHSRHDRLHEGPSLEDLLPEDNAAQGSNTGSESQRLTSSGNGDVPAVGVQKQELDQETSTPTQHRPDSDSGTSRLLNPQSPSHVEHHVLDAEDINTTSQALQDVEFKIADETKDLSMSSKDGPPAQNLYVENIQLPHETESSSQGSQTSDDVIVSSHGPSQKSGDVQLAALGDEQTDLLDQKRPNEIKVLPYRAMGTVKESGPFIHRGDQTESFRGESIVLEDNVENQQKQSPGNAGDPSDRPKHIRALGDHHEDRFIHTDITDDLARDCFELNGAEETEQPKFNPEPNENNGEFDYSSHSPANRDPRAAGYCEPLGHETAVTDNVLEAAEHGEFTPDVIERPAVLGGADASKSQGVSPLNTATVQGQDYLFEDDSDAISSYSDQVMAGSDTGETSMYEHPTTTGQDNYPQFETTFETEKPVEKRAQSHHAQKEEGPEDHFLTDLEQHLPMRPSKGLAQSIHNPQRPHTPPSSHLHETQDLEHEFRDVTNIPWHARDDSNPVSLYSQTTLPSFPSSPTHSPLVSGTRGPGQNGYGSPKTRNSGDDPKWYTPIKASPSAIFQKMRDIFENQETESVHAASVAGSPRGGYIRSRPPLGALYTIPAKRNSMGIDSKDDGVGFSSDDYRGMKSPDENTSLLQTAIDLSDMK